MRSKPISMNPELQAIYDAKMAGNDKEAERLWNHYKIQLKRERNVLDANAGLSKARMRKVVMDILSCPGNCPDNKCTCGYEN